MTDEKFGLIREKLEQLSEASFVIGEKRDKIVNKMVRYQIKMAFKSDKVLQGGCIFE